MGSSPIGSTAAVLSPMTEWTWERVRRQRVVHVDDRVLVIDKPPGIALVGERHGTDLMQQARAAGDWVMPAHRIDKVTSGLVLLARDRDAHAGLTRQFADRTVGKRYLAVVREPGLGTGSIDLPLAVGRKNRVRIAADRQAIVETEPGHWTVAASAIHDGRSYPARTSFRTILDNRTHGVLRLQPHTGRRHQLRVQLAWIGHPIEGDPLFCRPPGERTHLHAWWLRFRHPDDGVTEVAVDPDPEFWAPLAGEIPDLTGQLTAD